MSRKKHSSEFKCLVVQYFLEMHRGYTLTARHFSLERSVVRSWVRRYRTHGFAGLLRRQPTVYHTLAFKRMVVETMHNESLSAYQASSQFDGISPSSILKWKRLYEYGLLDGQEETLAMTKKVYRPDRKKPDTEKTPEELLRELHDPSQKSGHSPPLKRMLISQEKLTCPNALVQNLNSKL